MTEKLIILGSGPAGYTAGIYSARAGLGPLLLEGADMGGQLMITTEIENFPGFPKGIQGPDLMMAMKEQAERFGTRFVSESVTDVDLSKRPFNITTNENHYQCEALIISTGAKARWLNIPSETALRGKGVSACATCDGFFFKNQEVVVVGGGDTAIEEAMYLTHFAKKVTIVHRRDQLRASKVMQDKVLNNPKISFIWNSVITEVKDPSKGKVTGVILKNIVDGTFSEFFCDGLFVAIGHEPNTAFLRGQLALHDHGYIVIKPGTSLTSVEGVFAAGDVCDPTYRQATTAVGTGCMAAIDAEKWLDSK